MQSSFIEMCEKSMEQENARFERSAEMFRDAQSRQMEQTNAIVDIFKNNCLYLIVYLLLLKRYIQLLCKTHVAMIVFF